MAHYCKSVFDHLKPGGKFIGINDNPFNQPSCYPYYYKYGFIKESPLNRKEGDYIKYIMRNPDGSTFSFDNYYLKAETYLECFQDAGFKGFEWNGPFLNPGSSFDNHWEYFMEHPPIIGFTARK